MIYSAAHAVAGGEPVPIGGGGAICRQLTREWRRAQPFELEVIGPVESGAALVSFDERRYARFCREFSEMATARILREDPRHTVVLVNDISEAPDFRRLAEAGFAIVTIYHVDVVAYVSAIYLGGRVAPETTVRWFDRLGWLPHPRTLDLVWARQRDSVRYSKALVVPSAEMQIVLERCYPLVASGKVHVLPWGAPPAPPADPQAAARLRAELGIPPDAFVLLTLSRISPEKGQDTLLEALLDWERQPGFPSTPIYLCLCGEAAFMKGKAHMARLRCLASRLRRIQTFFPGHVSGARKQAFFDLADLYVFPSRHESYGLTLMEALQAGLAAVCLDHHGAREILRPEFGALASPATLWQTIDAMLARTDRKQLGENASRYAAAHPMEATAARLAALLNSLAVS